MARARVLLLGDATELAYQRRLEEILSEDAVAVVGVARSCGDCRSLSETAEALLRRYEPGAVVFSCGACPAERLHELTEAAVLGDGDSPLIVPMVDFERAMVNTATLMQRHCGREVLYVGPGPVHARRFAAWRLSHRPGTETRGAEDLAHGVERMIATYAEVALNVMAAMNVASVDLRRELERDLDGAMAEDGVSLTGRGAALAAQAVARGVYGVARL